MLHEYVGNVHLHTIHSDGGAPPQEIACLAARIGLDFVIPTDHDVYLPGLDGWYGRTLMLIGEELHLGKREIPANHYLVFDVYEEMNGYASDPQRLVDEVRKRGGFGFIAHPFERAAPRFDQPAIPWLEWGVEGYAGLSIWNYMSEFKAYLHNVPAALFAIHFPRAVIRGPFPETLAKWDELLLTRRTPIIGASDAHATRYKLGPLQGEVLPYAYLFRTVNLHVLSEQAFCGQWRSDKEILYGAMKSGTSFVAYDLLGDARGFRFTAEEGAGQVGLGQELTLQECAMLRVSSPYPADLRIIRNGQIVARCFGKSLCYEAREKGVYRVEAYRFNTLRWCGWVFTNPIYLV